MVYEELANQKSVAELGQDLSFWESSLSARLTPSCNRLDLEDTLQLSTTAADGQVLLLWKQPCLWNLWGKKKEMGPIHVCFH